MKSYYEDLHATVYNQDFLTNELPDESVQMVVTSPPYWGLRKYSGEQDLVWGEKDCDHQWIDKMDNAEGYTGSKRWQHGVSRESHPDGWSTEIRQHGFCSRCGAWKGAYGLEPNPQMYINHIVEIFEEVKRVLRRDGVCFVNCGDSYYASGGAHKPEHANPGLSKSSQRGGVPREGQSGKRGKGLPNLKGYDSSSESLCDVCVMKPNFRNLDKNDYPELESGSLGGESSHSHKVSMPDHQDSLGLASQGDHSEDETSGLCSSPSSADVAVPGAQESTGHASSGVSLHYPLALTCWYYLTASLPFAVAIPENEDKMVCPYAVGFASAGVKGLYSRKQDISVIGGASAYRKEDKAYDFSVPYPYYNIQPHLKAKDLCLIPQRLAIAFQDAGWWVRSIIIWSKPNPMPESVQDRPTESHEYILMLTKSAKYYWDADAVRTGYRQSTIDRADGSKVTTSNPDRPVGFTRDLANGANLKTVWDFATQPYPKAHFAVFPEKLPEICIKAASKEGDVVLDPFAGAGTTLWVAKTLNRKAVGYEISGEYCQLIVDRLRQQVMV